MILKKIKKINLLFNDPKFIQYKNFKEYYIRNAQLDIEYHTKTYKKIRHYKKSMYPRHKYKMRELHTNKNSPLLNIYISSHINNTFYTIMSTNKSKILYKISNGQTKYKNCFRESFRTSYKIFNKIVFYLRKMKCYKINLYIKGIGFPISFLNPYIIQNQFLIKNLKNNLLIPHNGCKLSKLLIRKKKKKYGHMVLSRNKYTFIPKRKKKVYKFY